MRAAHVIDSHAPPPAIRPGGLGSLRNLAYVLGALAALGLALNVAATGFGLGGGRTARTLAEVTYQGLIAGAAMAAIARAALVPFERRAWILIAGGLTAWALGELELVGTPESALLTETWLSHFCFFLFYVGLFTGLRLLAGQAQSERTLSLGFAIGLLGIATLWAGVFFGPGEGRGLILAADFAYPFLDVVGIAILLGIWAGHAWRPDPGLSCMLLGFIAIGIADVVYAVQVHAGTYGSWTVLDSLWPLGAVLIAAAAWVERERGPLTALSGEWLAVSVTITAGLVAVGVLVWDHIQRLGHGAVVIAGVTIIAALGFMAVLQRQWTRAHSRGTHAATLSSQALATIVEMQRGRGGQALDRRASLAGAIGTELGMPDNVVTELRVAAQLFKVGELAAPEIEARNLGLSPSERAVVSAVQGAALLDALGLTRIAAHIRDQHRPWDERAEDAGSGQVPSLEPGILMVVAEFEDLTSGEAGPAVPPQEAFARISAASGTRFDPQVVGALARVLGREPDPLDSDG